MVKCRTPATSVKNRVDFSDELPEPFFSQRRFYADNLKATSFAGTFEVDRSMKILYQDFARFFHWPSYAIYFGRAVFARQTANLPGIFLPTRIVEILKIKVPTRRHTVRA